MELPALNEEDVALPLAASPLTSLRQFDGSVTSSLSSSGAPSMHGAAASEAETAVGAASAGVAAEGGAAHGEAAHGAAAAGEASLDERVASPTARPKGARGTRHSTGPWCNGAGGLDSFVKGACEHFTTAPRGLLFMAATPSQQLPPAGCLSRTASSPVIGSAEFGKPSPDRYGGSPEAMRDDMTRSSLVRSGLVRSSLLNHPTLENGAAGCAVLLQPHEFLEQNRETARIRSRLDSKLPGFVLAPLTRR